MELKVNEREAVLIVSALSTYHSHLKQHINWDERKRMRTLRSRLADSMTIGDREESKEVRRAIANTRRRIERNILLGFEVSTLRDRLKADAGITDEKVNPKDDEEERVSEAQG